MVGLWAAAVLDRAGHMMLGLLTAALIGLLDSPISWDHHWVWVVPGMMVAGHYAVRFWQAGRRLVGVGCAALAAALLLIFAPWPGSLWGVPTTGPGNFTKGLIWAGPYTPVKVFIATGDHPWFKEYHWAGLQNLSGNAYVLIGLALLILLAVVALRARRQLRPGRPGRYAADFDRRGRPTRLTGRAATSISPTDFSVTSAENASASIVTRRGSSSPGR